MIAIKTIISHTPDFPETGIFTGGPRASFRALCAMAFAVLMVGGCAAPAGQYGRVERLPEGTLPPSKEVGPAVNIQAAPLGREDYRPPAYYAPAYVYGGYGYGPRYRHDPYRGGAGFGLHYRAY